MHRNKTEGSTFQTLRAVKDDLVPNGCAENFEVTKGLITKCKNSQAQYETYLAMEHRKKETEAARKEELEQKDKLAEIEKLQKRSKVG